MTTVPSSHIDDAHKLIADGEVYLFKLQPVLGGTVYFKPDDDITWQGNLYEGIPCAITGEKFSSDTSTPTPRLTIGQENVDLLPFKGLINDGYLEGATIIRYKVLAENLQANLDLKETTVYRVKRVESYSRSKITLTLATFSGAINQTYPFRQYLPPAFPWVNIT